MHRIAVAALAAALVTTAGCAKKVDEKKVEAQIRQYWRSCPFVVPDKFSFERVGDRTLRVSFVLRVQDPKVVQADCLASRLAMLQALANQDNPAKNPPGTEFPVIQEASAK